MSSSSLHHSIKNLDVYMYRMNSVAGGVPAERSAGFRIEEVQPTRVKDEPQRLAFAGARLAAEPEHDPPCPVGVDSSGRIASVD